MGCFIQIVLFLLVSFGTMQISPYFSDEEYSPGDTPNSWFRVVLVSKSDSAETSPSYEVIQWNMLEDYKESNSSFGFWLPLSAGDEFVLDEDTKGDREQFKVLNIDGKEQNIEVKWFGDDYNTVNIYKVSNGNIAPIYFFRQGIGDAILGLLVGIIVALLARLPINMMVKKDQAEKPAID